MILSLALSTYLCELTEKNEKQGKRHIERQ